MRYLLCAVAFACLSAAPALSDDQNSFAIRDVRVFDGDRTLPRANVVVRDGRIASVGNDTIPAGLQVIDGTDKTLLPGLIDSHVHVFPGAQADALRFGVTTELDMFDVSREFAKWRAQRQSLAQAHEADTWGAGLGVTVPGGAPLEMFPPDMVKSVPVLHSAAEAQGFIDARVKEGSDYIKIFIENLSEYGGRKSMPTLSRDEVCAVVKAAHRDHKLAIVHVQAEWAAREAIECGADALAHTFPDQVADAGFLRLAKSHHIFLETTVDVWAGASGLDMARTLAADPRVAPYLSTFQKQTLTAKEDKPHPDFFPTALANVRAMHAAGIPIVAGTDSPNPATAHGIALHEELQLLVRAGFTPEEALHAATALPDRIFHLGDRGHIAKGYHADLLLVDGDPTQRISDTLNIAHIWKNGYAVDRTPPKATSH
jgi:imidazolonepropionase-like amidohydrolase